MVMVMEMGTAMETMTMTTMMADSWLYLYPSV